MDISLDPQIKRFSRRMFFKLCLTVILAACSAPTAAPTAVPNTALPDLPEPTAPPAPVETLPPTDAPASVPTDVPAPAATTLPPTPACADDDDAVTPAQTEGPFFTPNSPERTSLLETGVTGTPMRLTGLVLATDCQPIAGALVDFWHADDAGVYDNAGYKLRGHQFTAADGRYTLETIVPGLYPGRTRHFHVKVQAANEPVLTTQLYFPDEPDNARDGIFSPALLIAVQASDTGQAGQFDFVLEVG